MAIIALALSASLLLTGCVTSTSPQYTAEIPSPFHGIWTYDASGVHPSAAELPWTVKARSISGHEFDGEVTSVSIVAPREVVVSRDVSAEGEEFKTVETLKLSPDGNQLTVTSSGGEPLTLYRVR
jgi:PBP1b-binding outer membrane lipoprotein LpoB